MGRSDDAHCLKCNRRWELDTLIESTGRTWVNTTYKKHRQKVLFDNEKSAEEFGKKSMKRGFEHKVVEYNEDNHERYWYK